MAFESLSEKLQNVFKSLKGKGRLSEDDVKTALKEVKMALLEADVNYKVVKQFVSAVTERAVGQDVMEGLNPGQMVIKIVNEELVKLMGSETTELSFEPGQAITVIMACGLQGAGKTTNISKLASFFKKKGKKSLLVACDIYRPAAVEQLKINGQKTDNEVFEMGTDVRPEVIAEKAIAYAKENHFNVVIIDTAGRLHVDEEMMQELKRIKQVAGVHKTLLFVDAMTGQDAVNVAEEFNNQIGIDGVVLTKMDGDARGGAALSVKAVTGKPILYVGMGEKLDALEQFYPDRIASRILGMGDVLSLIEKAQENLEIKQDRESLSRIKKGKFDYNDYLDSMSQMSKLGGLSGIMSMLPGMGLKSGDIDSDEGERALRKNVAIIQSMTPEERSNPKLMSPSRKRRIAAGCGMDISQVNRFIKQFEEMQKMMKQMPGMLGGYKGRKGFRFPF